MRGAPPGVWRHSTKSRQKCTLYRLEELDFLVAWVVLNSCVIGHCLCDFVPYHCWNSKRQPCTGHPDVLSCWWSRLAVWFIIIINPLTARVVGAPHMVLQPVFSIFPYSPLPSGTCRNPGLSIPWCCLPNSSYVCLVFFPLSLCLTRRFWPDLMNGKHDHTTAVLRLFTIVRRSSCGPIACWIFARTSSLVTWSLYDMCSILR